MHCGSDDGDVMGSNLLLISGYWRGSRGAVAINTPAGRRWGLGRRWELISNWTSKQEKPNAIVAKYSLSFKQVISGKQYLSHLSSTSRGPCAFGKKEREQFWTLLSGIWPKRALYVIITTVWGRFEWFVIKFNGIQHWDVILTILETRVWTNMYSTC